MKLRHAAALGLVVWYLMLPPNAAVRDISIPLAQWSVEGTFDTASDCQEAMASLSQRAESETEMRKLADQEWKKVRPDVNLPYDMRERLIKVVRERLKTMRCVSSDDPRLKEK